MLHQTVRNKVMKDLNKQDLLKGIEFRFESEDNDLAEVLFNERLNKFVIWFNGVIEGSFKTFSGLKNNVDKLSKKWDLKQVEI